MSKLAAGETTAGPPGATGAHREVAHRQRWVKQLEAEGCEQLQREPGGEVGAASKRLIDHREPKIAGRLRSPFEAELVGQ